MKCKYCNESIDLIYTIFVDNNLFCDDNCYREWKNKKNISVN